MSRILKVSIEGSKFFSDPLEVEFSKKLNCIMGGREQKNNAALAPCFGR